MSSRTPSRTRKVVIRVIALVLALLICGVLYDLYFPRTTHMREFDPDEVARLETAMWRSNFEKQRLRLFNQLSELALEIIFKGESHNRSDSPCSTLRN